MKFDWSNTRPLRTESVSYERAPRPLFGAAAVPLLSLRKMKSEFREDKPVLYFLEADQPPLNERLGSTLRLKASGNIHCIACGRKTSKSFNQGYCFPCMRSLAQCDSCMIKQELCHYHKGSCRDPKW